MWHRIGNWLRSAPVDDVVDRRNAPVMQLLLLFYGLALPSAWAWHLSSRAIPTGWGIVLALDLATSTLALGCVWLIRGGRFRPAMTAFLGALLTSLALAHYKLGTQSQLIDQSSVVLVLVIGGLVLGRRALWTVYALLMLVFAIGFSVDARSAHDPQWIRNALKNAPTLMVSYAIITLVLDRTITALRESLDESLARGAELQHEMAQRERAQSQLIHAQKMEASGRLASGVAHDFNNILGVMQGFAAQRHRLLDLDDDRERAAAMDDALQGIEEAAALGLALTRKLLGFARNDLLHIETFDAVQALSDMRPMLRQLFCSGVRVEMFDSVDALPVRLDRNEFELMVLNIAANARDAMAGGGVFRVETMRAGEYVRIALSDSGHGMDAHTLSRVFEPFFSTKVEQAGTGLGLSVVHDLVKAVGGDIRAESRVGDGTEFTIHLPLADASRAIAGATASCGVNAQRTSWTST
jgi:signal transduction histidine kinase